MSIIIVGGTDAPGIKIVVENGVVKIVKVPGWNPEQMVELNSALKTISAAARLRSPDAQSILNAAAKVVQTELGHLAGKETGGQIMVLAA